jgi:hypothetical protein
MTKLLLDTEFPNKSITDNLSDSEGNLQYDGSPVGSCDVDLTNNGVSIGTGAVSGQYEGVNIGYSAGSTGGAQSCVIIGKEAGYGATHTERVVIGKNAGKYFKGNYAVLVGFGAGNCASSSYGHRTIGIGGYAGQNNGELADDCVFIGYQAGKNNTTANKFILKQTTANASSLIEGDFSNGDISFKTPSSSITPHANGAISFYLDEGSNKLKVAVKYSDSTAKTGEVNLT